MKSYKKLSNRYLKVQKRRTILTVIGIILSVALITGVQILYASMLDYWERDARKNADYHGYFYDVDYDKALKIKNYVGVKSAVLLKEEGLTYTKLNSDNKSITFINKEDKVVEGRGDGGSFTPLRIKAVDNEGFKKFKVEIVKGRLPESENELVIDEMTYNKLNDVKIGDNLSILLGKYVDKDGNDISDRRTWTGTRSYESVREKNYRIVGIIKNGYYFDRDAGIAFTSLKGNLEGNYRVFIDVKNPGKTYSLSNKIGKDLNLPKSEENFGSKYSFRGNDRLLFVYGGSADMEQNLSVLLLLALVTGIIVISTIAVIYNSFNISVLEKSAEYGLLRSVGASTGQIRNLVLREASLMSIVGIPLGILSGFVGIKGLYSVFEVLNYKVIQELGLKIVIRPSIFIVSIFISILTVYFSALIPGRRAARVSPIEALKRIDRKVKIKKSKKSRIMKLFFGAEGEIAYKNLRRNRKRFVITVFSLALSVALYIGFYGFVDQAFYLSKNKELRTFSYIVMASDMDKNNKIFEELKGMNNVDKVYSNSRIGIIVKPHEDRLIKENLWWHFDSSKPLYMFNSSLNVMDEGYFETLDNHLLKGKVDLKDLDEGGVILLQKNIMQQNNRKKYMDYTNYQIGDYIEFVDVAKVESGREELEKVYENTKKNNARVAAVLNDFPVYDEYPNEGLLLITTNKGAEKLNLELKPPKISVYKKPNTDGKEIVKYINDAREKKEITLFHNVEAGAEEDRQFFITISILIYGFITLISLISSVNIFNTISSNLFTRKKELGVIKSVGMSQSSLRKMIYLEGFYYGLFAIIFGGAAGNILSYLFYKIFNISMNVKWTTSFKSLLIAGLGVMFITALSTYLPLKKLNSDSIIESIKNEE